MELFGDQAISSIDFGTITVKGIGQHYEDNHRTESLYKDGRRLRRGSVEAVLKKT